MKIGLHVGKFSWENHQDNLREKLIEIATTADKMDFSSFWIMDHLFQLGEQYGLVHGPIEDPMLEAYTTISYLSAITQKIKLGVLVTCNFFRHPGLLIKMMSSMDRLSKGRVYFGLGAGWFEKEATGLGIPWIESLKERFERLEETLQIAHHMWKGNTDPFIGKHYQLQNPINNPSPAYAQKPIIVLGGSGEKKTLKFVAQYADACNLVIPSPLTNKEFGRLGWGDMPSEKGKEFNVVIRKHVEHKLQVLKKHCADVGRPYKEIEKTMVTYIKVGDGGLSSDQIIEYCQEFKDWGIDHTIFNIYDVDTIDPLHVIGKEVIPAVRNL